MVKMTESIRKAKENAAIVKAVTGKLFDKDPYLTVAAVANAQSIVVSDTKSDPVRVMSLRKINFEASSQSERVYYKNEDGTDLMENITNVDFGVRVGKEFTYKQEVVAENGIGFKTVTKTAKVGELILFTGQIPASNAKRMAVLDFLVEATKSDDTVDWKGQEVPLVVDNEGTKFATWTISESSMSRDKIVKSLDV